MLDAKQLLDGAAFCTKYYILFDFYVVMFGFLYGSYKYITE